MIGIIGAMDEEIEKLKDQINNLEVTQISNINFYKGEINGIEIVLAKCYEGKVNSAICTQTMILKYNPKLILNVGVAGGISDKLNIGGIAISASTIEFDSDTTTLGYELGYIFGLNKVYMESSSRINKIIYEFLEEKENVVLGVIASSDKFISNEKDIEVLKEEFDNVVAVDMESASICHVCNLNDVEFCAIRAISDSGDAVEFRDFLNVAIEKLNTIIVDILPKL